MVEDLLVIDEKVRETLKLIREKLKSVSKFRCKIITTAQLTTKRQEIVVIEENVSLENIEERVSKKISKKERELFGSNYFGVYNELNVITQRESDGKYRFFFYELVGEV